MVSMKLYYIIAACEQSLPSNNIWQNDSRKLKRKLKTTSYGEICFQYTSATFECKGLTHEHKYPLAKGYGHDSRLVIVCTKLPPLKVNRLQYIFTNRGVGGGGGQTKSLSQRDIEYSWRS